MSSSSRDEPVSNRYTPSCPPFSINFRLTRWVGQCSISCRIGLVTLWVNGTVVLEFIGLLSLQGHVRRLPGIPAGSNNCTSRTPASVFGLDWAVARASSEAGRVAVVHQILNIRIIESLASHYQCIASHFPALIPIWISYRQVIAGVSLRFSLPQD